MTPEQQERFEIMAAQTKEMHDFFFKEFLVGHPTRAAAIDTGLTAFRGYKFSSKLVMVAMGFMLTVGSAIVAYETLLAKIGKGGA